jgi:hypothetical protein
MRRPRLGTRFIERTGYTAIDAMTQGQVNAAVATIRQNGEIQAAKSKQARL